MYGTRQSMRKMHVRSAKEIINRKQPYLQVKQASWLVT